MNNQMKKSTNSWKLNEHENDNWIKKKKKNEYKNDN